MDSTILTLLVIIVLLAFVFVKTKAEGKRKRGQFNAEGKRKRGQFNAEGKRKSFKDFEQERQQHRFSGKDRSADQPFFELGGYGVTRAENRHEKFFKPSGEFSDERIVNDPRGIFGEAAMAAMVARVCDTDKRKYVLMRNLYIPTRGGTTEIDALLLHQSGIYVLESKNLSGEISGSLEEERWNQRMNERLEHTFHNPIRQNIGHILALQHHLQIRREQSHFISVIVFSDRCILKQVPADNEFWNIVHCSELRNTLQKRIAGRKTIYSTAQLEDFYWKLDPCMHASETVKENHRNYIETTHKN